MSIFTRSIANPLRAGQAIVALRILVAGLIAAHGWARLLAGGVQPFGDWLGGQGIPFGFVLAAAITALEMLGTPLLALGRFVRPLALAFAAIYVAGIVLVHAPAGWFVVGLGRNRAEYSVLLIAVLIALVFTHRRENP